MARSRGSARYLSYVARAGGFSRLFVDAYIAEAPLRADKAFYFAAANDANCLARRCAIVF